MFENVNYHIQVMLIWIENGTRISDINERLPSVDGHKR